MELQVLLVCGIAFAAVFVLLSILSVTMSIITSAFRATEVPALPAPAPTSTLAPAQAASSVDEAMVAAITNTVMNLYPNARVSKIEELK